MALVHEFENSGNWLFRRRSWLPVFFLAGGFLMMFLGNRQAIIFDLRDEMIFLGVSIFGEIIRILTVGYAPRNTSGRNTAAGQVADELNTTGIYSIVRHPLYVGNFLMWLGPVLFLRSVWFTVVFGLVYWLYYERIMFAEEQFLRRKFGEAYDTWSKGVKAFLPFRVKFIRPKIGFSPRNVLKREYNSFVNIFVVFAALDIFRNLLLKSPGTKFITPVWMWMLAGSAGIWLIVRSIHKYTRWLEVEGR
ncbi:MAG: isoprenylcysteine carboxylmethyltransferase family protein [Bacteroidales bacterium]|jgi:protein-S-isoprenylcysteine O-methyltransferase Ste14|nr:isoprenylcysteine carboxylmethyltransferase family protein [Bacteroidales bacterium]